MLAMVSLKEIEKVIEKVEWATLLFFVALQIVLGVVDEMGFVDYTGKSIGSVILGCGENARLAVGIIIIMVISAFASCVFNNIPTTTVMVKVVTRLGE